MQEFAGCLLLPHFERHALRLTLLGDFAYDFYPKIIRNPYDEFTKFLRRFFEEFLTGGRRLLGWRAGNVGVGANL